MKISPATHHQIKCILKAINENLQHNPTEQPGLLHGRAGELLFLHQLAQAYPELVNSEALILEIEKLRHSAEKVYPDLGICTGMTGIGWFFEYIATTDYPVKDVNNHIDELIKDTLDVDYWYGDFEYMDGLAGWLPYMLRRCKRAGAKQNFSVLLRHLRRMSVITADSPAISAMAKNAPFRFDRALRGFPDYNLGLAHGSPAIIAALLPVLSEPIFADTAIDLLVIGLNWLEKLRVSNTDVRYFNASFAEETRQKPLGWCSGDLPIALIFAKAAILLGRPDYLDIAINIGLSASLRTPGDVMIPDAGICHGSAGVMLMFNQLYKYTAMEEFSAAAKSWLDFTLSKYEVNGLNGLNKNTGCGLHSCTSLLDGYAGVGLALLAAQGHDSQWTEVLLIA